MVDLENPALMASSWYLPDMSSFEVYIGELTVHLSGSEAYKAYLVELAAGEAWTRSDEPKTSNRTNLTLFCAGLEIFLRDVPATEVQVHHSSSLASDAALRDMSQWCYNDEIGTIPSRGGGIFMT